MQPSVFTLDLLFSVIVSILCSYFQFSVLGAIILHVEIKRETNPSCHLENKTYVVRNLRLKCIVCMVDD